MKRLERRVQKLEGEAPKGRASEGDTKAAFDERWAKQGTSRAEIIAKYGSVVAWVYAEMFSTPTDSHAEPDDDLSAMERYMRMIGR